MTLLGSTGGPMFFPLEPEWHVTVTEVTSVMSEARTQKASSLAANKPSFKIFTLDIQLPYWEDA